MSVEWFFKLKEIDSLTKMKNTHLRAKSEQEDRLSKLNDKRQEALSQSAKLKQDLIARHDELAQLETKLKTASVQKQRLQDIGGDEKKITQFQTEIDSFEEQGLELLAREEEIETEMNDTRQFLTGLDKTILEIKEEVTEEVVKIQGELVNIELRIQLLQDELPSDFKNMLQKVTAKKLAHGPFTRVDQGSCYFCRFKISRIDESEIDMQRQLKSCPQCGRIFLPYGA